MSQDPTPYDAAIVDLEGRIRYFETMLESMKQLRSQISGSPMAVPSTNGQSSGGGTEIQHDSFFGMTIGDAANKYLKMAKATKPTGDIASALERGGLKHSSKDFNTTVRSVLGGREDFLRVNGDWGLTEWYPGMRIKDRKPKPGTSAAEPVSSETGDSGNNRPKKDWVPKGNAKAIIAFLAMNPESSYTAITVAREIKSDKPASVASLLSELAKRGFIGRGVPNGYTANPETVHIYHRLH